METKLVIKNVVYTPREVDVMSCIVMGVSDTKTITLILNLSNSTVEKHIQNIIKKMQVNSRRMIVIILQNDKSYNYLKKHYTLLKHKFIEHTVNCDYSNTIVCNEFLEGAILGCFKLFLIRFLKNTVTDIFIKRRSKNFFERKEYLKRKNHKNFLIP